MATDKLRRAIVAATLAIAAIVPTATADGGSGAVYALSNAASGNAVLVYDRATDGSLTPAGSVGTDGSGTGGGLGSQGAIVLEGSWLYAVNAASDTVAILRAHGTDVALADVASSGGDRPTSITAHGNLVYVLNAGTPGIAALRRSGDGELTPIAGSARSLTAGSNPGQISFSPDGRFVIVVERAMNRLTVFPIGPDGTAGTPTSIASPGSVPFGFTFTDPRTLVVSEAATGTVSSYTFGTDGSLSVADGAVADFQAAPCWFVATRNGRFAYTTNAASGSISGFAVAPDGGLSLLDANGITFSFGAGTTPLDEAVDRGSRWLYALLAGTEQIAMLEIGQDGSLSSIGRVSGLPDGAAGLAAS